MKFGLLRSTFLTHAATLLCGADGTGRAESAGLKRSHPEHRALWNHENLVAWCVVPFDAKRRNPEERAQMLQTLGFKHFAYDWRGEHVPTFDAELEALKQHGIEPLAWWFPLKADDPLARSILETFKRHHVHPQLWVPQLWAEQTADGGSQTHETQTDRVNREAERIAALVRLAAPYGSKVELYNHNDWFGLVENEVAIIKRLDQLGVKGVGMVYNFSHAHDAEHDDTVDYEHVWREIKPYLVVVNVAGINSKGDEVFPSQGPRDLALLRTIQDSGWSGRIGVIAEQGGDASMTLRKDIAGLDWLSAELAQPGSGGAPPFTAAP